MKRQIDSIKEFLSRDEQKGLLRVLTAGSVDDGKSTLIGRLLVDSKQLYEDQLQALEKDSQRRGNAGENIDYALLCDGLKAEREQGITIDVAYRYFATNSRKFIIADTPGHEQYTRNMITGGSTADLAIILVDARYGVTQQTRRHSTIISLLGIEHVVLSVNKMDLVGFSEERFNNIVLEYKEWLALQDIEFSNLHTIPVSALLGDNVVTESKNMPWFSGLPLLKLLESVEIDRNIDLLPFRFPIQLVIRPNLDFRGFAGKIASGVVSVGDSVVALPSEKESKVKRIVTYDGDLDTAFAPQSVTITLDDEIDLSRGEMLVLKCAPRPTIGHRVEALMVWMDSTAADTGKNFYIKHNTHTLRGRIDKIVSCLDVNRAEYFQSDSLTLNQIAKVEILCSEPIIGDNYKDCKQTGSFIVIDPITNFTSAVGMITKIEEDEHENSAVTLYLSHYGIDPTQFEAVEHLCRDIELKTGINIHCCK